MRKDIFIVGTRLLGIWQLLGALTPFAYIIGYWFGYIRPQPYTLEYNVLTLIVHLITGLYLLFRTQNLYDLLNRLKHDEDTSDHEESNTVVAE